MTDRFYAGFMVLVLSLLLLQACTQDRQPCLTPKASILKAKAVRVLADGTAQDTALPAAVLAPLTGGTLSGTLYPGGSSFTLSLSPVADSAQWIFATDTIGVVPDTITFRYERQLHFISNACGYTYYYTINSVTATGHSLDSAVIKDRSVNSNANTVHTELYIHPQP